MKKRIYNLLVLLFLMGAATVQVFGENARFFPANSIRCLNATIFDCVEDEEGNIIKISPDTVYVEKWIGNDTIVDGRECVTLWRKYERNFPESAGIMPITPNVPLYSGVVYEAENGYVFYKSQYDDSDWTILYDFSDSDWQIGDSLYAFDDEFEGPFFEVIRSLSTYTLCNGEQIAVANGLMYGIGYNNRSFFTPMVMGNSSSPKDIPINFYRNDELLWGTPYKAKEETSKFFADDTKWYGSIIDFYRGRPSSYYDLTYHIGADTITDRGFGQNLYRNDEYWGTLITKGEQVWLYPSEALLREGWYFYEFTEPFLLYDFSLQPNDTLFYTWDAVGFSRERPEDEYFQYMVVKNVYHTHGRKVIEFNEGYRWAEGIGCLGAPVLNIWRPMTTNGDGRLESIDRVEVNGQVIYSNDEFVNPNIESWLKAGMTWTENKQYTKDGKIVSRKVTISEGDTPGFYKVSSNDSKYKLPFTRLQVTNNKVYGHGLGNVFLLYDFSLKVGDKVFLLKYYCYGIDKYTYKYDQCYVTKVDTVIYNGVSRKRITLSGDREDVWVEGIGSLTRVFPIDGVVDYEYDSVNAFFSEVVECTYNGETLYHKSFIPAVKKGYGIYRSDTYLEAYTLDESKEVTDSTGFARWYDKTVIYFDVDTIGPNAFSGATFRQGQVLYFTERLNTIFKDAFTDINIIKRTSQEALMSDDLTLVFAGANPPSIDKSHIMDYADSTYHINYVVPDLATYIASDIQWAYTSLITIDDFIRGYISPENEVTVNDSTEMDVEIDEDNTTMNGNVDLVVNARPRKDIPVRIGEGENKDIYSRAPAWMRYTVELKITDTDGTVLYTDSQQCSAYGECEFKATFARPANGIVLVYSRSIDQFGRATEWAVSAVNLDTSIDTMIAPDRAGIYYDLQGRPVAHPTRGIYIRNGKKVVM